MADLDFDRQRAVAIESMIEMARDAQQKGDANTAAGFFEEAARLLEAHAESTSPDGSDQSSVVKAKELRDHARSLRLGERPEPQPSTGPPAIGDGSWEVVWTQGQPEGKRLAAPSSEGGPPWEPFAIGHGPGDPRLPIIGWRRQR